MSIGPLMRLSSPVSGSRTLIQETISLSRVTKDVGLRLVAQKEERMSRESHNSRL